MEPVELTIMGVEDTKLFKQYTTIEFKASIPSIKSYATFQMSSRLQYLISTMAANEKRLDNGYGDGFYLFEWSPSHTAAADQTIIELVRTTFRLSI